MTNIEINNRECLRSDKISGFISEGDMIIASNLMDKARADEREKMQGVEININGLQTEFQIWSGSDNATFDFLGLLDYRVAEKLGLKKGQWRKFKIVECVE